MAIMNYLTENEWNEIQNLIFQILSNRKFQFTQEGIFNIVKQQFLNLGISENITNCPYFRILLLNMIDFLVDNGILYQFNNIYIPTDYMALKAYDTKFSNLFYFDDQPEAYINVESLENATSIKERDFLLTGGFKDKADFSFFQPNIPLNEIHRLYHSFKMEGANKEETINHILNYYSIQMLSYPDLGNVVSVKRKIKTK